MFLKGNCISPFPKRSNLLSNPCWGTVFPQMSKALDHESVQFSLFPGFAIAANISWGDPGAKRRKKHLLQRQHCLSLSIPLFFVPLSLSLFFCFSLSLSFSFSIHFSFSSPSSLSLFLFLFLFLSCLSFSFSLVYLSMSLLFIVLFLFLFMVIFLIVTPLIKLETQKATQSSCSTHSLQVLQAPPVLQVHRQNIVLICLN